MTVLIVEENSLVNLVSGTFYATRYFCKKKIENSEPRIFASKKKKTGVPMSLVGAPPSQL